MKDEELTEQQKWAIFYRRRQRWREQFIKMGGSDVAYHVIKLEKKLDLHFDRKQFFDEINSTNK